MEEKVIFSNKGKRHPIIFGSWHKAILLVVISLVSFQAKAEIDDDNSIAASIQDLESSVSEHDSIVALTSIESFARSLHYCDTLVADGEYQRAIDYLSGLELGCRFLSVAQNGHVDNFVRSEVLPLLLNKKSEICIKAGWLDRAEVYLNQLLSYPAYGDTASSLLQQIQQKD